MVLVWVAAREEVAVGEVGDPTMLRPADMLCFQLKAATQAVAGLYRSLLDELNLTYPQYLVLLVLQHQGQCSVKEVGLQLHLDTGTLSPLLKRLAGAGLITRERSSADERTVYLGLTEEGRRLAESASTTNPVVLDAMGLRPDELVALHTTLQRLTAAVMAATMAETGN